MTSKVLSDVLTRHGSGVREGDAVRLSRDLDVTLLASVGQETLTIFGVAEVSLEPDVVVVTTRRSERYVLAYEDVRGLRFAPQGGVKPSFR